MSRRMARAIRITGSCLFLLYLAGLVYFLFFAERYGRNEGTAVFRYNLLPFREILRFWNNRATLGPRAVLLNLIGNVAAFVPFGALLPVLRRRARSLFRISLLTFLLSLCIETTQLLTRVGSFDVDDLLLNTVGGILGYGLFFLCDRVRRRVFAPRGCQKAVSQP